jgi:hypothetical protein
VPAGGLRLQAGDTRLVVRARRFGEEWLVVGGSGLAAHATAEVHPLRDAAHSHRYVLRADGAQAICRL